MQRVLFWGGVLITLFYIALVTAVVDNRYSELKDLKLNEVGDFLAGVLGPITIVWLIFGFLQQGIELRQNNEALRQQALELKNSVEQQTALADAQKISLRNYEKTMEPLFKLTPGDYFMDEDGDSLYPMEVRNLGEYCEKIRVHIANSKYPIAWEAMLHEESRSVSVSAASPPDDESDVHSFKISVSYINRAGIEGCQTFVVSERFGRDAGIWVEKRAFLYG